MHELTIAQSIIEIAEQYSAESGIESIEEIDIEIGELSGVVKEALEFALETSVKGTVLEMAKYNFINIHGKAVCNDCNKNFEMHSLLDLCPVCGGINRKITDGKQLRIKSLKYN
jgi:hydrogenase nickel incorporation protein HypA/HybF